MSRSVTTRWLVAVGCVVLLVGLMTLSLLIGSRTLTLSASFRGLFAHDRSLEGIVVWQLRMPRTLLAVLVGAALAVAGG